MMKQLYKKNVLLGLIFGMITFTTQQASAQITYLGSQFYENQYLGNPAMAGVDQGINVNLSYRSQWRTMPGSPVTQSFTGEYGKDRVGAGLNIYNDKAGLHSRLRAVGSYAYHLPLNDDTKAVHFGVSMGVSNSRFDKSGAIGDEGDTSIDDYKRKPYLIGDFGMAYTTERLTLQAALPNMKKYFEKDSRNMIDRATFLMSMSYKIGLELENVYLEPKVSVRGAKGVDNIVDIGTNVNFQDNLFNAMAMYHSNKSFTVGFGVNLMEKYQINGYYTSEWTELSTSFGGNFEISLRANVFNH